MACLQAEKHDVVDGEDGGCTWERHACGREVHGLVRGGEDREYELHDVPLLRGWGRFCH